jgi:hypothetical protein
MNHGFVIEELSHNAMAFRALLAHTPAAQVKWRPSPDKWSILEVVNHLCDEEKEDFGFRVRSVLENPEKTWPAIAPQEWVTERGYARRNYDESVARFIEGRAESVAWLKGLIAPNWKSTYHHPQAGPMSAEMILANWLAHDYLHMRQIVVLKFRYLAKQDESISLEYAGTF